MYHLPCATSQDHYHDHREGPCSSSVWWTNDSSNFGLCKFVKDESAVTVCLAPREVFVSLKGPRAIHGDIDLFRTHNGLELVNALIDALLLELGITRELTSPDGGQKRNGKVERRIGLARERGRAGFEEAVKALDFSLMWPEAFAWMSDCINIIARVDQKLAIAVPVRGDVREASPPCLPPVHDA